MDLAAPHERMLLDLQVKCRSDCGCLSSVAELCEGLVVFIQAFFAFLEQKTRHKKKKKPAGNAEVDNKRPKLRALLPSDQVVCAFLSPAGGEVV